MISTSLNAPRFSSHTRPWVAGSCSRIKQTPVVGICLTGCQKRGGSLPQQLCCRLIGWCSDLSCDDTGKGIFPDDRRVRFTLMHEFFAQFSGLEGRNCGVRLANLAQYLCFYSPCRCQPSGEVAIRTFGGRKTLERGDNVFY